jgi:hypothetical protein
LKRIDAATIAIPEIRFWLADLTESQQSPIRAAGRLILSKISADFAHTLVSYVRIIPGLVAVVRKQ